MCLQDAFFSLVYTISMPLSTRIRADEMIKVGTKLFPRRISENLAKCLFGIKYEHVPFLISEGK